MPQLNAAVAQLLNKNEIKMSDKAKQALLDEKDKLVARGRIHAMCCIKKSELPEGHEGQKYKGRVVFQGNRVKDQNGDGAIFAELSSSPSGWRPLRPVASGVCCRNTTGDRQMPSKLTFKVSRAGPRPGLNCPRRSDLKDGLASEGRSADLS